MGHRFVTPRCVTTLNFHLPHPYCWVIFSSSTKQRTPNSFSASTCGKVIVVLVWGPGWFGWFRGVCLFVLGFFGGEFFERSDFIVFPLVFQKALIIRTNSTQWIPKMVKKLFVSKEWHGEFLSHLSECIKQNCCWWMVSRAYKILVRL